MLFAKSFLFAKTSNTNHLYNSGSRLLGGNKTKLKDFSTTLISVYLSIH